MRTKNEDLDVKLKIASDELEKTQKLTSIEVAFQKSLEEAFLAKDKAKVKISKNLKKYLSKNNLRSKSKFFLFYFFNLKKN